MSPMKQWIEWMDDWCTVGIKCTNNVCVCTAGKNAGKSCDGSTSTGPNASSVVCVSSDHCP